MLDGLGEIVGAGVSWPFDNNGAIEPGHIASTAYRSPMEKSYWTSCASLSSAWAFQPNAVRSTSSPSLLRIRPCSIAGTWALAIEKKVKALTAEIKALVQARGSNLMDLPGVGPVVAARVLADVGDVARFADRNRFASWTGTAPLDVSSGEQTRHRLSRAGNRRMNRMLHIAATTQIRLDTEGRAYYLRKIAAGKTRMEAMRCLKRRLSDAVYRQLVADAQLVGTGPGGHCGATQESSAVDLPPHIDTSDQPLPGPAKPTLQRAARPRKTAAKRPLKRAG